MSVVELLSVGRIDSFPIAIQSNYLLLDFFNFFNFSNSIFITRLWLFFEERS